MLGRHKLRWKAALNYGMFALVLALVFFKASLSVADVDLHGHLRFGQDIWTSGSVVKVDHYSYLTEGQVWINHEWLSELLFYLAWKWRGAVGLGLLKIAAVGVIFALLLAELLRAKLNPISTGILICLNLILMLPGITLIRPQLFSYLLLFLLALLLKSTDERPDHHYLWLLPLIFLAWINLHGGVLAGLAVLVCWTGAHHRLTKVIPRWMAAKVFIPRRPARAWVYFLAAIAALLINPYHYRLMTFLLRPATVMRSEIMEWRPLDLTTPYGVVYLSFCMLTLLSLSMSRERRFLPETVILGFLVLLPFVAIRHVPLVTPTVILLMSSHYGSFFQTIAKRRELAPSAAYLPGPFLAIPLLACLVVTATFLARGVENLRQITLGQPESRDFPVRAVAILKASRAEGNLVVYFDWGEYVIWHLAPKVRVSLDGRRETVYSDATYRANLDFIFGRPAGLRLLEWGSPAFILIPRDLPVYRSMLAQHNWILAYEDKVSALFVRDQDTLSAVSESARHLSQSADMYVFP